MYFPIGKRWIFYWDVSFTGGYLAWRITKQQKGPTFAKLLQNWKPQGQPFISMDVYQLDDGKPQIFEIEKWFGSFTKHPSIEINGWPERGPQVILKVSNSLDDAMFRQNISGKMEVLTPNKINKLYGICNARENPTPKTSRLSGFSACMLGTWNFWWYVGSNKGDPVWAKKNYPALRRVSEKTQQVARDDLEFFRKEFCIWKSSPPTPARFPLPKQKRWPFLCRCGPRSCFSRTTEAAARANSPPGWYASEYRKFTMEKAWNIPPMLNMETQKMKAWEDVFSFFKWVIFQVSMLVFLGCMMITRITE